MNRPGNLKTMHIERFKRVLMMCCALVLFALGVWLLIEPVQARGFELVDNVDACSSRTALAGSVSVL